MELLQPGWLGDRATEKTEKHSRDRKKPGLYRRPLSKKVAEPAWGLLKADKPRLRRSLHSRSTRLVHRRLQSEWLIQRKFQQRFTGHMHLLAVGYHLDRCACSGAHACADGRAFSASCNCADDRTHRRPTTRLLSGVGAARLA